MATHSSILAWRIPWTEEPSRLRSIGLQRVGQTEATYHTHTTSSANEHLSCYCCILMHFHFITKPSLQINSFNNKRLVGLLPTCLAISVLSLLLSHTPSSGLNFLVAEKILY